MATVYLQSKCLDLVGKDAELANASRKLFPVRVLSTKLAMVRKRSWVIQLLFQQCQLQVWSAWYTGKLIHPVQGKSVSLQMTLISAAVWGRLHRHSSSLATQWQSHCLAAETEGGKETELKHFKMRTDVWEELWRDTGISNGSEKRDMKERKREGRGKEMKKNCKPPKRRKNSRKETKNSREDILWCVSCFISEPLNEWGFLFLLDPS